MRLLALVFLLPQFLLWAATVPFQWEYNPYYWNPFTQGFALAVSIILLLLSTFITWCWCYFCKHAGKGLDAFFN